MFSRTLDLRHFLRRVYGTESLVAYCEQHGIPFEQTIGAQLREADYQRWLTALRALNSAQFGQVELELSQVDEMADPEVLALLIEAVARQGLPPDTVAGDAALALWFLLHHRTLFQEAFLSHEVAEFDGWRIAHVPAGIRVDELPGKAASLAASLQEFFQAREGIARFCAVDDYQLDGGYCFVANLSDRLRLLSAFTEDGQRTTQTARPAVPLMFVYEPGNGRLLLKTRRRAVDKLLAILQRFGRTVLGVDLDERCLAPAFRLNLLKQPFNPLPDAGDMEQVRVKALHLVYPGRLGRRRVKLETLSTDGPLAILDLLREHAGSAPLFDQLDVLYAELQVKLRAANGSKSHVIRLWRDRTNLNHTALGERFSACLKHWGIVHAA